MKIRSSRSNKGPPFLFGVVFFALGAFGFSMLAWALVQKFRSTEGFGREDLVTLPFLLIPVIFMLTGGCIVVSRVLSWFGRGNPPSQQVKRNTGTRTAGRGYKFLEKVLPVLAGLIFSGVGYGGLTAVLVLHSASFAGMELAMGLFFGIFTFFGTAALYHGLRQILPRGDGARPCFELRLKRKLANEIVSGIIFCTLWNVFCLMFFLIIGGQKVPLWHPITLITSVFQVIGILTVGKLVRLIVRVSRGPRYEVRLTANALKPGEAVRLDYTLVNERTVERLRVCVVQFNPKKVGYGPSGFQTVLGCPQEVAEKGGGEAQSGTLLFTLPPRLKTDSRLDWRLSLVATYNGTESEEQFALPGLS